MSHGLLDGKVVVVTGAARSLGAVIAKRAALEGARVIATDILQDSDGRAVVAHDVTLAGDWERVLNGALSAHGRLDGLVNNAAIMHDPKPFLDETPEDFERLMAVNVSGVWLGMQAAGRRMRANKGAGGSIVNIASTAGLVAHPGLSSYGTSKWAVRGLTKYAAGGLGPDGIRVNSVHPGGMMGTTMFPGTNDPELYERTRQRAPLRRVTDAADVADTVVWLLSDLSKQMTGRELVIDGGATLA